MFQSLLRSLSGQFEVPADPVERRSVMERSKVLAGVCAGAVVVWLAVATWMDAAGVTGMSAAGFFALEVIVTVVLFLICRMYYDRFRKCRDFEGEGGNVLGVEDDGEKKLS